MASLDQTLDRLCREQRQLQRTESDLTESARAILDGVERAGRGDMTATEQRTFDGLLAQRRTAVDRLDELADVIAETRAIQAEEATRMSAASESHPTGIRRPPYDQVTRVNSERRTYSVDTDPHGAGFLNDLTRSTMFGDPDASERLQRHHAEERVERGQYMTRAVGTAQFVGLTVPQYLTDQYAAATAALRPFADACTKMPLPADGMTVNISRITTATSAAIQANQNVGVSETNADDTILTLDVVTVAGQQTISRQAVERGTGIDQVLMEDLAKRYASALDSALLNTAATGAVAVGTAYAYTDASPTAAELYTKLIGAQTACELALLGQAVPDLAVMHPRRWGWLTSQQTSTWPFITSPGIAPQTGGTSTSAGYGGPIRGYLPNGLAVVTDSNLATNVGGGTEDEILVTASAECRLWEDPNAPLFIRAEQTLAASLGVLIVTYGYHAFTASRYPNSVQRLSGTGLIAPTWA